MHNKAMTEEKRKLDSFKSEQAMALSVIQSFVFCIFYLILGLSLATTLAAAVTGMAVWLVAKENLTSSLLFC